MPWKPCVAGAALLLLAACSPAAKSSAPVGGPTINGLMSAVAEPSAETLWQSVKTVADATGVREIRPTTDAEWETLRLAAQALKDTALALPTPGRRLVAPGDQIEAGGTLSAKQIELKISAEQPAFTERAKALEQVSDDLLGAIKARDVTKLTAAGGALDEACEACHLAFYYPEAPSR